MRRITSDAIVAIVCLVFGLVVAFAWAPLDSGSPIFEQVRGSLSIGDAMAPTVAAGVLLVGATGLLIDAMRGRSTGGLTASNLRFLVVLAITVIASLAVMRWTGPLAVGVARGMGYELPDYRLLRDTAPWKYLGFIGGGTLLIGVLISYVEHRVSRRTLLIAFLAALAVALFYGVPFKTLVLPPNGDV